MNPLNAAVNAATDIALVIVITLAGLGVIALALVGALAYLDINGRQVRTWGILHHRKKKIEKLTGRLDKTTPDTEEWKRLKAELENLTGPTALAVETWTPQVGDTVTIVRGSFEGDTGVIGAIDLSDKRMTYRVTFGGGYLDRWFARNDIRRT